MGTNEPGEIAVLAQVARPDIGVIVTVGEAHLEKLGSVEGVLHEKLDLLRNLAQGGRCVVGDEPADLPAAAREICPGVRVAGWSERADEGLRPEGAEVDAWGIHRFRWRGHAVTLGVPGRHAAANAMLALAVSELLVVGGRDAARGLSGVGAGSMRAEVRRGGDLTLVVDCYNANPPSVRAALDLLCQHAASRRVAVLGTMLELGDASPALHREVLRDALSRDLDLVVATGGFAAAAEMEPADERILIAPDWKAAYPRLRALLDGDEVVLLKASRGVAMEGILSLFEADFGATAGEEA